jgi:ubiquinone/menaquinone biosynthesis C-methylase UbiE
MMDKQDKSIYMLDKTGADPTFLDIQAEVGISKHFGGYRATDILYQRCQLATANEVLDVGCGIGIGPAYIAKQYKCQVKAVDISQKMLSWAKKRAVQEGVFEKIGFQQADILELPFEDNRFDAVVVESVLAFVVDKQTALKELIRVTRPGGYLGLNEYCWEIDPPENILSKSVFIGMATITTDAWDNIWKNTGLVERMVEHYSVKPREEFRDRINWVGGWGSIFKIWGRVIKLLVGEPQAREAIKQQIDIPVDIANMMGYSLLTGRKPLNR